MSRGFGVTQRFILHELAAIPEGEWLTIQELARRYTERTWGTEHIPEPVDRTIRAACRRLAYSLDAKIKIGAVGNGRTKRKAVALTERGRLSPWAAKQQELASIWLSVRAEQARRNRR